MTSTKYLKVDPRFGFNLQSRNLMAYSDLDDRRFNIFFKENWANGDMINTISKNNLWEVYGAKNSITYLENEVAKRSEQNNDDELNKVLPYMSDYYPILTFTSSDITVPSAIL